ncbi:Pentatricopeptide repeat-containing protein [Nymphaea thermarum]|nr:Pentatricopeptide repeat-containing protein [Nymphaea thermarum]
MLKLRPPFGAAWSHSRSFATKYTGRVVHEGDSGRTLSVAVDAPDAAATAAAPRDVRGYAYPRKDLVCRLAHLLRRRTSSSTDSLPPDLLDYLQSLAVTPTPLEVSEALRAACPSPATALAFFRLAASLPGFRHDVSSYNRMINILGRSGDAAGVASLVGEMKTEGVCGTISTINMLIEIFGASPPAELDRCLGLAARWGLVLNCYSYKCLVQACLRSGDADRAYGAYQKMRSRGFKLDVVGYNMMLDALAKHDQVDKAYKVFQDMKQKHCEPDEYTYTILIRMAGKKGRVDEFLSFFDEMISKGCTPNLIAYNTMLQALATNHMVERTVFLFSKMVEKGCRPNEFTYKVILQVLVATRQLDRLSKVVEISKNHMNKGIYAYMVRTLSRLGHASEAHKLFCNMWSHDQKGHHTACLSMLENLCNAGKTEEALDLLTKIEEYGLNFDSVMYNLVFSALGKARQVSSILDLYEKMKKDGPPPDVFTYNILISTFGRMRHVKEALRFFEEMEKSDSKPDVVTYNSLINCLGKNGELDEAHMRFKEMQEKGLAPDVVTYSTLIECFGKSNRVEMASKLFDEMIAEGCYPNIVTYNILLDCLEKCGKTSEAVKLYERLKQQGLTPDNITYSVLERLQSGSRRVVRVQKPSRITGWVVSALR